MATDPPQSQWGCFRGTAPVASPRSLSFLQRIGYTKERKARQRAPPTHHPQPRRHRGDTKDTPEPVLPPTTEETPKTPQSLSYHPQGDTSPPESSSYHPVSQSEKVRERKSERESQREKVRERKSERESQRENVRERKSEREGVSYSFFQHTSSIMVCGDCKSAALIRQAGEILLP